MPRVQRSLLMLIGVVALTGTALVVAAVTGVVLRPGTLGGPLLLVCALSLLTDITATDVRIGRQVESYTWAELTVVLALALLPDEQVLLTAGLVALSYYGGGVRGLKLAMNAGCYAVGLGLAVLGAPARRPLLGPPVGLRRHAARRRRDLRALEQDRRRRRHRALAGPAAVGRHVGRAGR